jgi:hypothetical protein
MSSNLNHYLDYPINSRIKISALWAAMLFLFLYVDLISMYRADVRADIEAGKVFAFTIGQAALLGMTVYILIPSLMVFLSLALPAPIARTANVVSAVLYALTVVGGAIGEWNYYILGSLVEVALLAAIAYYAWTWPKASDNTTNQSGQPRSSTEVDSASRRTGSSASPVGVAMTTHSDPSQRPDPDSDDRSTMRNERC